MLFCLSGITGVLVTVLNLGTTEPQHSYRSGWIHMLRRLIRTIIYLACFELACTYDIEFSLQCYHKILSCTFDVSRLQALGGWEQRLVSGSKSQ
jgi:hypothetical protein